MNEKQILLVKNSWNHVVNQLDEANALFIKNLVRLSPSLKPIFKKVNQESRSCEIMETINHIVATLPHFSKAENEIRNMQREYANLGITPSDYDSALFAFLMTLEKKSAKEWCSDTRDSWTFTFASVKQYINDSRRRAVL